MLFIGCELGLGCARVLVMERLAEVDETIKAGAINIASAVAFDRRGLLPELETVWEAARERMRAFRAGTGTAKHPPKFAGHFAGITMDPDLFDGSDPAWAEAGPAPVTPVSACRRRSWNGSSRGGPTGSGRRCAGAWG
ncbi:hypothetical protein [Streptomyces sp. NPDC049915]|uniref:hypothetical protein n=1 Tax=Streptomyces sp. NPDC049915 TaxID=3155510 RepID=UPI003416827D